ncbi:MAG TPA: restriction endonuclease subunit S, partial [Streptosporangiaceae bacterium]
MLRFDPTRYAAGFILQYLLSPDGQKRLKSDMSGNAITRLTLSKIKNFSVPIPPLYEQRGIAEILRTLDEVIRSTARLIAKLEQTKQGLLRDLLARGIDESGHLRDPARNAEQFSRTTLGLLPKQWLVRDVESVCSMLIDCPHTTPRFLDRGVLVARTSNIRGGQFISDD